LEPDTGASEKYMKYIGGLSFDIYKGTMLILDYEHDYFESGGYSVTT